MRLAARLCLDPLGELQRSPGPSSCNWGKGPTSKGKGGKRRGRERRKGEGKRTERKVEGNG